MKEYITYGFTIDDIRDIKTDLTNIGLNKPKKALWGSPTDAEFGWKDWCEVEEWWPSKAETFEDYISVGFTWTLEEGSKVYEIHTIEDLEKMDQEGFIKWDIWGTYFINRKAQIDFQKLKDAGYVAVELFDGYIGHMFVNALEESMNYWDCESIVVLDPSKVVLTKKLMAVAA